MFKMKVTNFFSFLLLLVSISILSSCNKDDDMGSSGGDAFLTCKIDGVLFTAEPITVGGISQESNLSVQGNGSGLEAIAISMALNSTYNGPGVYNFGANHLFNTATYLPKASDPANVFAGAFAGNNVGQIEITKDDGTYLEGTFSFQCANQNNQSQTASVTEGTFKFKLP